MFYVYIMANRRNGTIYIGMTDDLHKRVCQHREGAIPGFTKAYGLKTLVWFEAHSSREDAFRRERQLKEWRRSWKLMLIEGPNPTWGDLFDRINDEIPLRMGKSPLRLTDPVLANPAQWLKSAGQPATGDPASAASALLARK